MDHNIMKWDKNVILIFKYFMIKTNKDFILLFEKIISYNFLFSRYSYFKYIILLRANDLHAAQATEIQSSFFRIIM